MLTLEESQVQAVGESPTEGGAGAEPGAEKGAPRRNVKSFISLLVKGAILGVAGILPGASGGVLAVSLGIYRRLIDALSTVFKTLKKNIMFLLPLGLGAAAGFLGASRLVEWLLANHYTAVMFALIGLVLGGMPSFIKEANEQGFRAKYLLGTLVGLVVVGGMALLESRLLSGSPLPLNWWTAALAGGILAVGTVIPGLSTSFILMFLGIYEPLLSALNSFNIGILACVAAGALVVAVLMVLLVKRMFERHRGYTYYAVLGFSVGSVALIFPPVEWGLGLAACAALFAAGFVATFMLCKFGGKQ